MSSRAATWTLDVPIKAHPDPESKTITDLNHGIESIVGRDFRELVASTDFQDGGKYRSIVKIQSRFRDSNGNDVWMMGTGWLIRPDILVTAGHVVYDHAYGCGATTQIKCYIGYNGAQSVPKQGYPTGDSSAVPRYGSQIVTTDSWIKDSGARDRDVAFIRVHKPFVGSLNLFNFTDTISPAMLRVGVVGYPGDKDLNGEKGAQMYELFDSTPIDLDKHPRHMISYNISTYGGQSGAPVLSKIPTGFIAIGTHCYGAGNGEAKNTGNSIGGQWGNDYNLLISVFASSVPTTPNDIEYVAPGSSGTLPPQAPSERPKTNPVSDPQLPAHPEAVEGLLDVLGQVARIGGPLIQAGSSLLGPMGQLVTSAAGGLLGALAGQESTMEALVKGRRGTDIIAPGVAERAVLAEASLQAVLRLMEQGDANDPVIKKVVHHMAHNYTYCAPKIGALSSPRTVFEPLSRKPLTGLPSAESSGKQEAFIECLLSPTCPLRGGEEGAFNFLGPLISGVISFARPIVSQAANAVVTSVLPQVINRVVGVGSATSSEATLSPVSPGNAEAADLIFTRALVADTAVSALMSLTREELDTLKIKRSAQEAGTEQQEGIVDYIKTTMQQIGPFALGTAKSVITRFAPVLIDIAANKLKEKISPSKGSEATPSLKRQPSNLDKYRPNGVATDSAVKFSTSGGALAASSIGEPPAHPASPAVSFSDNFLPKSRGDGFGDMKGRSANDLVFAAKGSGLPPTSTAPWNPDQPLILTTPPPDFPA
ncbi:ATP synthase f1 [Mycena sanguinolenta]|uniref:Serine protease n=1 Tax=Mycena sanguinolenta TaxID=230812 RepID=A0A8H6Y7G0_9AGAR|nr:ATP synthase f1 [Mycena sanguinolenta]